MHHHELTLRKSLLKLQDEQAAVGGRDAEIRHKGNTQADFGQIDQQIIAAQLNFRHQVKLMLLEHAVEKFAGGAFFVQHEDRIGLKLLQAQLPALQGKKFLIGGKYVVKRGAAS